MPGVHVKGVGKLSFPLTKDQSKALKDPTVSFKTTDDVYTKIWHVEASDLTISNPEWQPSMRKLLNVLSSKLGVHPARLSAQLDSLLYMERGSNIDWCSTVEEDQDLVGTLFVQPPSSFSGGLFRIFDGEPGQEEECITCFDMGEIDQENEYKCFFFAHYNDCQYEMQKIKSGNRVVLRYSLRYSKHNDQDQTPSASLLRSSMVPLQQSLDSLPRSDRIILVPLGKMYKDSSLVKYGVNALSPDHRAMAEALTVAGKDWKILIVQAKKTVRVYSGKCTSKMTRLYNMLGEKVSSSTKKWLENVVSFAPLEEAVVILEHGSSDDDDSYFSYDNRPIEHIDSENHQNRDAMLLTESRMVAHNWGAAKTTDCHGYYDDDPEAIYHATFLLAYDESSELELRCLEGHSTVKAECRRIVQTNDLALLDRVLTLIETKKHCGIESDLSCCILDMLMESSDEQSLVISLVSRLLLSSPTKEPRENLWTEILFAVQKFGWKEIGESVALLLNNEKRKKGTPTLVFITRIEFVMKLREIKDAYAFAQQYILDSTNDFLDNNASFTCRAYDIGDTLTKIENIVEHYGWKEERVVVTAINHLISNVHTALTYRILDIGHLAFKIHVERSCNATKDFTVKFAKSFSRVPNFIFNHTTVKENRYATLLQTLRVAIDHGSQDELNSLGGLCVRNKTGFSLLLKIATEAVDGDIEPQSLLRDLMNHCLFQHAIPSNSYSWKANATESDVSPSLHIEMIFEEFPNLAYSVDHAGRLPLHHAVAQNTSYEILEYIVAKNPVAATVHDPVSGLYPFMIAGSVDNASAAFKLLLASPNLVAGDFDSLHHGCDEEMSKKRKRSLSLT